MLGKHSGNRSNFFCDIAVLAVMSLLNPLWFFHTPQRGIPDKRLVVISQQQQVDSISTKAQLREIDYYIRTHDVTDEGYDIIARQAIQLTAMLKHGPIARKVHTRNIKACERLLPRVLIGGGCWHKGHYWPLHHVPQAKPFALNGPTLYRDGKGRIVQAMFESDSVATAVRTDCYGTNRGQLAGDAACGFGSYDALDGTHYEGYWHDDQRNGFGTETSPYRPVRVGQWRDDRFLGERLRHSAGRIYGIDISRHQHEKGRRRYGIQWNRLRITSLGAKHAMGEASFPVSFVYIKSTEGTSIRNRYFLSDYQRAKRQGLHVGAYHFFSMKSGALAQATYFVNHTLFRPGDFPPVLDVEPNEAQIRQIGGEEELLRRIRSFMEYVERRTHMRPILYVNQQFVNRHLVHASDIKQRYNVWIARYGQYKPDVRLAFWQLSADGRVTGITGPVDINVFNGYQAQWDNFIHTGVHE